jgi:hypothetical protein
LHLFNEVLVCWVCFSTNFPLWNLNLWAKGWVYNNKTFSIAIHHKIVVITDKFVECAKFLCLRYSWKTNLCD